MAIDNASRAMSFCGIVESSVIPARFATLGRVIECLEWCTVATCGVLGCFGVEFGPVRPFLRFLGLLMVLNFARLC